MLSLPPAKALLLLVSSLALAACATSPPDRGPTNTINSRSAARFAPYAMMAANSYHRQDEKPFRLDLIGWRQVNFKDQSTTEPAYSNMVGVQIDIFKKDSDNSYAFVFRGTDSKIDWFLANFAAPFSIPYKSAKKQFKHFLDLHPGIDKEKQVVVIGHSLGGGEALSVSVHEVVRAIVFDTSPRVFDGFGDGALKRSPNTLREAVYQRDEILARVRAISTKYPEVVDNRRTYICDYKFEDLPASGLGRETALHSSRKLAEGLVRDGAKHDAKLKRVVDELPPPSVKRAP